MVSIQQNIEEFIKILNSQKSGEKIQQFINDSERNLFQSPNLDMIHLQQGIIIYQTQLTNWLKQNIQSPFTAYCYKYCILLYQQLQLQVQISPLHYYKVSDEEEKQKDGNQQEGQGNEMRLKNEYLYLDLFLLGLSHLQSFVDSKKITCSDPNTQNILLQLLRLLSLYGEEKEIQAQCRRQKLLKVFLKIFQDIYTAFVNKPQQSQMDMDIAYMAINFLAKITFSSKKNQDYVIKKKGHELVKGIIVQSPSLQIYQATALFLANCSFNTDARLLLWVAGIFQNLKKRMIENMQVIRQNPQNGFHLQEMEASLVFLHKLCTETKEICEQIQQDVQLMDIFRYFTIHMSSNQIVQNLQNIALYANCIGIIRKIAGFKDLRKQVLSDFLENPGSFLMENKDNPILNSNKIIASNVYKELLAILGVFALDEQFRLRFVEKFPTVFNHIVKIALNNFNDAKLVKTAVGCITNFSVIQEIRDNLSKEQDFYVFVYNVIETYDYSISLLEYTLKLVLNTSQSEFCFKNFSSQKFLLKLIFLSFIYQMHYTIIVLLVKIFRVLSQNDIVVQQIIKCARDYEELNKEFKFSNVVVEGMKTVLNPQPDMILDMILFLAVIMQQDKEKKFVYEINDKTQFVQILREYIDRNRNDGEMIEKISQCVAFLPLEDLKSMLEL